MEEVLEEKDLEAIVSFAFVLNGQMKDFLGLRRFIREQLAKSRLVYHMYSRNPLFLVSWNDLSEEKKLKLKEVKQTGKVSGGLRERQKK